MKTCFTCNQVDLGQTGEYSCPQCGLPTVHDEPGQVISDSVESVLSEIEKVAPCYYVGAVLVPEIAELAAEEIPGFVGFLAVFDNLESAKAVDSFCGTDSVMHCIEVVDAGDEPQ